MFVLAERPRAGQPKRGGKGEDPAHFHRPRCEDRRPAVAHDALAARGKGELAAPTRMTVGEVAALWIEGAAAEPPTIRRKNGESFKPSYIRTVQDDLGCTSCRTGRRCGSLRSAALTFRRGRTGCSDAG